MIGRKRTGPYCRSCRRWEHCHSGRRDRGIGHPGDRRGDADQLRCGCRPLGQAGRQQRERRRSGLGDRDFIRSAAWTAGAARSRSRRGIGLLASDGAPPLATAILLTSADTKGDWLRAGQALHRVLAHAAASWVFATLYSQPLESAPTRDLIRRRLRLSGAPQLLLQFGLARTTRPTARRAAADMMIGGCPR